MTFCKHENLVLTVRPLYDTHGEKIGDADIIMCPACGSIATNKLRETKSKSIIKRPTLPATKAKTVPATTKTAPAKPPTQPAKPPTKPIKQIKKPATPLPSKAYGANNTAKPPATITPAPKQPQASPNPNQSFYGDSSEQQQTGIPQTENKKK